MTQEEKRLTELNEGRVAKPYTDTVGKLTIGVGWNLSDNGLPDDIVDDLLLRAYQRARNDLLTRLPWASSLDDVRLAALTDLSFNLGITKLLRFRNTLVAIKAHDWEATAKHLRQSLWFQQVGERGPRIIDMFRTGQWPWA